MLDELTTANKNNCRDENGQTPLRTMQTGNETPNGKANGDKPEKDTIMPTGDADDEPKPMGLADVLGEFGFYQLSLTLLTFIRYICVAMMTNTGPLIAPKLDFTCQVSPDIEAMINLPTNETMAHYLKGKCSLGLLNGTEYECNTWSYDNSTTGVTLTNTFDLVCGRDWLRSNFQSTVSIGIVLASVLWGSISDKYGRRFAMNIGCCLSLLAGLLSYFAPNFIIYSLSRALCSMSDVGLVVSLATIIVETLGVKFRGAVCIYIYTGWAMGVMIMPWITEYFINFRHLMLFTVTCHIVTLPWLATVGESIRWNLVNGNIQEAGKEVRRISRWNGVFDSSIDMAKIMSKFVQYKGKFEKMALRNQADESSIFSGLSNIFLLFQSTDLATSTIMIIWITFNSELLYMLSILVNSDIGDDVKLNYFIGGLVETLATLLSVVIVSRITRRFSLTAVFVIISTFCVFIAFTHQYAGISVWALNLTKLAISTLSSLVYVVTTEIFPTNLRQTGIGLAATLGSLGAVIAPYIRTELTDMIGMTNVWLILFLFPLSAAILIPFFLRETMGVELADDIDDIEFNVNVTNLNAHEISRRGSNVSKTNPTIQVIDKL